MAKLTPRYSKYELETLLMCIHSEVDGPKFTKAKWAGEGFRWYRAENVACIEHYRPKQVQLPPPRQKAGA
jgi:hypothetical protein